MAKISPTLTFLILGAAAVACASGKQTSEADKARSLLIKTLDRNFAQNVIAIISQRSPENHGTYQRIQVQISKDGKMRQTVIYPLSMQGVETIDDGKQSATYLPDERVTLIQESSRLLPNDTSGRINLTNQNYALSLGGTGRIAGRRASVVIAKPRHQHMETRRFHIDESSGFLLQLETVGDDGAFHVAFKALQVTYPEKINPLTFNIDLDARDGHKLIFRRRTGFFDGKKGLPSVGFEATFPTELPCGFDIQDAQVNDSGSYRSVAVRITDGLVKGTVYQYAQATAGRIKATKGTTIGDAGGIRFVVAADVPEVVRRKILGAFLDAARKSCIERSALGLLETAELFPCPWSLCHSQLQAMLISELSRTESVPFSE